MSQIISKKKMLLASILTFSISLLAGNLSVDASQHNQYVDRQLGNTPTNNIKIATRITRQNNFIYEFRGCRKLSGQLECIFKITYVGYGNAPDFSITSARIFSGFDGNQYDSSDRLVAGRYSVNMISQQPIKALVYFPLSSGLRSISTLEMETNYTSSPIQIGRGR